MKRSLVLWTLTLVVLSVSLTACCGGGKETVVVVPAESNTTAGSGAAPASALTHSQPCIQGTELASWPIPG